MTHRLPLCKLPEIAGHIHKNIPQYTFLLLCCTVLCSCAPAVKQYGCLVPESSVYIQPENPLDLSRKRLLIAPIALYSPQAREWTPAVTSLVQDIFSQERVFKVIVTEQRKFESEDHFLDYALDNGFDYILKGRIPPVIFPSGNTSGWVGFDMKIINTKTHVTVWHIYGQASLIPAPTKWSLLGDAPHADAPSVSEGFTVILRQMACIINSQPAAPPCAKP